MRPSVGILLPTRALVLEHEQVRDAERVLDLARQAERSEIDSLWVGDSLTAKPRLEPLVTLAAVASVTSRCRLGTAVLLAALRHPVTSAHAIASLDLIAGGRVTIGAGVGGAFVEAQRKEWSAVAVEPESRAARLEEWIRIVKGLTRGETVGFDGEHFQLDSVRLAPRSPQRDGVPLLLATHWNTGTDRQHRRALRLADGYIGISDSPEDFGKLTRRLRDLAAGVERDFDAMDAVFYMTVNLNRNESEAEREADEFIRRYYGLNVWKDKWGPFGHPERISDRISAYAEAGAKTVILRFASFDQQRQLEKFCERVLSQLK